MMNRYLLIKYILVCLIILEVIAVIVLFTRKYIVIVDKITF